MNLCSSCIQKIGVKISNPQLLRVTKMCDGCRQKKSSLDIIQVIQQALIEKDDK